MRKQISSVNFFSGGEPIGVPWQHVERIQYNGDPRIDVVIVHLLSGKLGDISRLPGGKYLSLLHKSCHSRWGFPLY